MSDQNVLLRSLRIIQARGIQRDAKFEINDLGNVNVIFGRNGVGKSTVGLAIYKLLRPTDALLDRSAEIGGQIQIGERDLNLRVAMSLGQAVEKGESVEYPDFKSAGELSRYRLALEELIKEDDVEFAKVIADETRGGIDLRAVEKVIGAKEKPQRPIKLETEWKKAHRKEEDCQRHQTAIARQSEQVDQLKREKEQFEATLDLKTAMEAVQSAANQQDLMDDLDRQLGEFPDAMGRLKGGEAEQLRNLQSQLEKEENALAYYRKSAGEAKAALDSMDFLAQATPLSLKRMEELQAKFADGQRELRVKETDRSRVEGKVTSLVSEFADVDSVEQMEQRLAAFDLAEVDTIYHEFVAARQRRLESQTAYEYLKVDAPEEFSIKREEQNLRYQGLQAWCGATDQQRHNFGTMVGRLVNIGSLVMAVWAVVLAIIYNPLWAVAVLVPVIIFTMAWKAKPSAERIRPTRQEIEATEGHRYPELSEWSPLTVKQLMDDLIQQINQSTLAENRYHYFKATEQTYQQAQQEYELARGRLAELATSLGLAESGLDSEMKILKIVKTFVQWRVETAELDGIEQALAELREKLSQQSEALTAWLPEFGLEAAESTTMFRAEVREAGERLAALQEARKSVDDTEREVRHASDMASSLEEQITTLLDRLGAAGKSAADLEAWETELPRYSSLVQQRLSAETLLNVEKAKIESRPEVKAFDSQQIKDALLECEGAQKRIQDLTEGIEATKARVESIQEGTALADAIALKVEKEDELRDDYHDALESLAGYCLVDFLINESEGENSSWVFEQASAMLHRITGGKLSLHVQPSESGEEFVISDAVGDRRKLDALSVGERVQVLLAVRLAFLSMGETSALPIVVDEALGTADDDRAHEIIESLVNLAKGGRQVFYFTAQTDEVEKWRAVLDCQEGVTGTFIDLDHLRGLEANLTPQQTEAFIRRNTVPPPQDVTHAEYGERLGVKLPNARMFRIEALSIWAVLDDVDDVYHCWQRRIRTVGMLDENAKRGEQTGLDPAVLNLAIVRANALAAGLEEYWAGRARPLEIEDLIQSGAIKERWLEPLWDLAIDVDRDGAKLIESLTAGDLKRFRQDNTIALEASLRESGKIIEAEASTPDQVEAAVAAVFAREGIDPAGQMEWGLARLFQILGDYRKTGESDG